MSNNINYEARMYQKHDTELNWNANGADFIPQAGEIIIYDPDSTYLYARIKVGDGVNTVLNLPFCGQIEALEYQRVNNLINSIDTTNLQDNQYPNSSAVVNYVHNNIKQIYTTTITLNTSWTGNQCIADAEGVTATNLVWVSPIPESINEWGRCGVYCSGQGENMLYFNCSEAPIETIAVNLVIYDTFTFGDEVYY